MGHATSDHNECDRSAKRKLDGGGARVGWLIGWLVGWLIGWLVGCLVGWLVGCLVGWLIGWLVGWLIGWLVGWLVDWLVGWLIGRYILVDRGSSSGRQIRWAYAVTL